MAVSTYIVDKDGNQIDAASATVPANRDFRGAWVLDGSVISEDMDKAKEIFKDKIREVRKPLLEAKDVERKGLSQIVADSIMIYNPDRKKFLLENFVEVINRIKVELEVQYNKLIDYDESLNYYYIGEANHVTG